MKKNPSITLQFNDITLRLIKEEDIETYYDTGFANEDKYMMRFTGNERCFSKQEIIDYVKRIILDDTRYDFLIYKNDVLLGEIVLNEIDWKSKNCGFRIALFKKDNCDSGVGSKAIEELLRFAFHTLQLHRIELEVFDYNPRAQHVYEKAGFQIEGRLKEALYFEEEYHDIILMAILNHNVQK